MHKGTFTSKSYRKQNTICMMKSSNGKIFRVTGLFCREFTGYRWIPRTKTSDAELWCFLSSAPEWKFWVNNREAGDLRRHRAHYDVIVMMSCYPFDVNAPIPPWNPDEAPTIESTPHAYTQVGGRAEIACVVSVYPTPYTTWHKGGKILEDPTKYGVMRYQTGWRTWVVGPYVSETTWDDLGSYVCSARNSVGSAEEVIVLEGLYWWQ